MSHSEFYTDFYEMLVLNVLKMFTVVFKCTFMDTFVSKLID